MIMTDEKIIISYDSDDRLIWIDVDNQKSGAIIDLDSVKSMTSATIEELQKLGLSPSQSRSVVIELRKQIKKNGSSKDARILYNL
jgi:predicted dinucleotide-utilizing enzyme